MAGITDRFRGSAPGTIITNRNEALQQVTMVISREKFEEMQAAGEELTVYEKGTNPHTILQFLATNRDKAFKPKEIAEATGIPASSVRVTLTRLESNGFVEHTDVYWSVNEYELGTRRAVFVGQRAIDAERYAGYDRTEEDELAELPPDRELRE